MIHCRTDILVVTEIVAGDVYSRPENKMVTNVVKTMVTLVTMLLRFHLITKHNQS